MYCSCNLKPSASLRTDYSMHANASPPAGGPSDNLACGRDHVTEKAVMHRAPCLSLTKASRALSFVVCVSFGKKVKLGRGLPPSC